MNKKYLLNGSEYSVEEIQAAADRNKITFEEYVSSKGFEIIEEQVETEKPVIPEWAFDAAGIVEEKQKQTKSEALLKEQPLKTEIEDFNMVEEAAVDDFREAYTSGQFNQWLQSEEQIKAAEREAKAEELITQPNIQTALINSEYTVQDIRDFQSIGVQGLPDVSNFEDPNAELKYNLSAYQIEETREALKKSGIYTTFERANARLNSDKRFDYVSSIVKKDNNQLPEEQVPNKVNEFLVNNMIATSDDRAKSYLGSSVYNKYINSDQKGKNEILKDKFNSETITALVDENGNFVDVTRVSDKQKQEIANNQVKEVEEYSNLGTQALLKVFKSAEDEVASLATSLVSKGQEKIYDDALLIQKGNELLGDLFPSLMPEDDKTLRSDFNDLEFMARTGIVPKGLTYLPQGDSQLVSDYNKALRKLQTVQLAVGLNVDLTKLDRESSGDILGAETEKALGFGEMTLGISEMQNTLLYAMEDELGFKAKEEEIERLGLSQADPNFDGFYVGNTEKILASLPGFTKMSMEMAATFYLTGGVGNVAKITSGVGDLVAINMARFGLSPATATTFGRFTGGVLQESIGLTGSNTIGSNIFGSEEMPVFSFAAGSQLGHLGMGWLGKVIPKGIARYATENPAFGNVVDFVNKMPGGSTIGGALKFGARPAIGTTAIKGGEFTSGLVDVAQGEQSMDQLWHHITDADSFIETYGALLFMSAAHPTQVMKKAVDNFQYDMLKLNTDMPSWNKLALDLGLQTKKTGSWTRSEVNKAVNNLTNKISADTELTAAQAEQQIADIKAKGKRLGIKRQLDIEAAKVEKVENWNTTYKNLQRTVNSIKAGNKINATDIKNLVDAGIANSGASPILELQTLGFNNKAATDLYKFSKTSYNEAQQYFKNPDSKSFKNYIESGIRQMEAKSIKDNLKLRLDMGDISNAAYEIELAEVEGVIEGETVRQKALIDIAQGDTKQRIKETIDYSEQVKAEGSEVKELSQEEFIKEKQKLGGKNTSQSIGYGFQTTVKGKPTFVINKDAMAPSGGEYRFESGGKEYVVKGFQGSTLKHEIFHPVFENKFSNQSVEQRARKLAGSEGDIDAARETIIKEDIQYIDQFKNRLKELGVFNRVEQEMKRRPGYNELIQRGERSVEIEKEFINEFLELQNEGALNSLVKDIKFKNVKADVITELKNGADVADYFFTGVEQTPEGKAKVKQAQEAYKKLVKDGDVTIQTSEKDLQSLAKEYKENPNTIELEKVEDLIQQYTANGIDALKRIANTGKRKVPVNTKDPKVRNGIADLLVLEFDSFIRNYDPTKGKPSTYMNLIAERILPKYVEKFKPTETTRIDDLTREIADTKTPETDLIDKESAPKEVERLVSVFEGKEAKAKEKEIIEVFKDLRSNPKQLEIARTKGFGGTPKEQLSKVAEFLFNVPDGTKVSNPSKNVLPTINIVDLKGKKISSKKLKAGEKGIVDAKDFLSLRDYFKDKNNLRRFLNVSLPEYNVNTPRSIVNTKGEIIEVSPDVVGRGIRLPDRIYDYFYEQFIDPTGEMTTPSGRGKGKTSQVPKVYKIKPEFRNPTNEVIEKVSKDILADIKLDDLPSKYTRDIAQLVKGMALTETMAVSNQAKRTKLPAETAAEKKLIADIKSSSSKLSMSEKLITEVVNKSGVKSIPETLGTKEAVNRLREVMLGDLLDIGGNLFYNGKRFKFINSGVLSSRSDFKKAIKEKFPFIGDYEAGVRNYTKRFIKEGLSEKKAKAKAIEEMKPTRTALDAGLTLQTKDFQNEVRTLFRSNSQKYNKFTPEEIKLIDRVLGNETVKNLDYNSKNFKDLKKGKDLVLDVFKEIIEKDPKNIDVVAYMLWHPNSNSHPLRNLATIVGKELGQTRNYEEHMLPFSEYSQLVIKGLTSSKESWAGLKKWLHENYTQEAISNYMGPNAKGVYSTRSILDHPTRTLDKEGNTIEKWSSKDKLHPLLKQHLEEAIAGKRKWEDVVNPDIRKYNEYKSNRGYVNPNKLNRFGETDAKRYNVEVDKFLSENPAIIAAQNKLIYKQLTGDITAKTARERLNEIIKVKGTKEADLAFKNNKSELDNSGVMNTSEKMTTEELVEKAKMIDKALQMADRPNAPVKKIRIFDFDDTLATSKNIVVAERGGERIELNAEEFAEKGMELIDKGYAMDFSDFNKVTDGGRGPLFKVAEKIKEARGNEDLFVLTARAPESQRAIYEFLKAEGLEFKEGNIIGLGNSTGEAKANWIIEKAAEGYNDFYFADDAMQNVKAVKTALNVIDVKSKVQQARLNTSEKMNTEFNKIIEQSSGIDAAKVFSDVKAQIRGGKKKGQRFFIPPSAEDFQGLLYVTLPKGIKGEKAMKFYQDALLDPYTRAMTNLSTSRVNIMADFKALKKELDVPKDLKKETESGFTNEQAVRVYLWNKAGEKIPGLSKTDLKELNDIVEKDPKLKVFADEILSITKGDGYSKPGEGWANGTITTDLVDVLNTTKRGKYLETWKENVDVVFSKENLNKLEAAYGKKYREAVENSLARMRTGSNRTGGGNRLSNRVLDYINNSTGVTMFINARSALLQTISSANYINWSFNNPYQAGKAFANQPQFWKDFKQLINSDYLKDRRNGLKLNISESEIANAAKTSKNKAKAVLSYILEKGYAPTKYADSFAIAFGGASYYRNRVKDLMKNKGMSEAEANKQALIDWRAESEKSQQSSDPSKISAQQSSDLGRVVLQYVNTPMQYARLQKRDIQDIINKRRMPGKTLAESNRTRVSRIIYYAAIQNAVFNGLQQGLFSIGFGDDEISENEEKKIVNAANGMLDSSLRGLGMTGVTIQVLKNLGIDIYRRSQRGRPEYTDAYYKLLEFSPAIKSKLGRFRSAAYPFDSKKRRAEVFEKGFALNNPAYESAAKVITATTNVPLDRVISKTNNMRRAFDDDVEAWMSVAMILGWPEWQLEEKEDNKTNKKSTSKTTKGFKTTSSKSNPFAVSKKKADNPFAIAK